MTKKSRPNFSPEIGLETARLEGSADAMGVGYSTLAKGDKQLRDERAGKSPKGTQ